MACTTTAGTVNIAIGGGSGSGGVPTGIGAVLSDANPLVVKSVALGNVNGVSLGVGGTTGKAQATKDWHLQDQRYCQRRGHVQPDGRTGEQVVRARRHLPLATSATGCRCGGTRWPRNKAEPFMNNTKPLVIAVGAIAALFTASLVFLTSF